MITDVAIRDLRGIRSGELHGLTALTVLTGRNGGGKSTVLDAIALAGGGTRALVQVVTRRRATWYAARWLLRRGARVAVVDATFSGRAPIQARAASTQLSQAALQWRAESTAETDELSLAVKVGDSTPELSRVAFDGRGPWLVVRDGPPSPVGPIAIVDPSVPRHLDDLYTDVVRSGQRDAVTGLLASLVEDFVGLELLTTAGRPELNLSTRQQPGVPLGLVGDGLQAAVHVALHAAAAGAGQILLVEEPEVFQHPGALRQTARALVAAAQRDVQVILTTHSLELIDELLLATRELAHSPLSLQTLGLRDGELLVSALRGHDLRDARELVAMDLR